ncbi:MAG: hypothetical protein K8S14_06155, partial [Actinomycetia bacterium]|nr:hypothetical protein [Actinomycetes bacterium]
IAHSYKLASGVFMPDGFTLLGRYIYPDQVLFLITAIARFSAEIPLSWVHEPDSTSMGMLVRRFNQYAKINIANVFMIIMRRKKP